MEQQPMPAGMGLPPEPKKKDNSLFGHKEQPMPDVSGVKAEVNNLERRLRVLEEGTTNIRRSLQVTEQNMLSKNREFNTEIKALGSEFHEIKREISEIKERMVDLLKDLENAAKLDEVKVLEKYVNMWNPIKFVTGAEVERIIEEKLSQFRKF